MNYDRQITISVGNNRRDMVWKQTVLTVEELYKRLSTPVRGTETLQDYLHLKKSQQDDLKDVGGFVGGSLLGQRRKANNVTGATSSRLTLIISPAGRRKPSSAKWTSWASATAFTAPASTRLSARVCASLSRPIEL